MEEENNKIHSELKDAREEQRLNIPAKRLKEKLTPIPSSISDLQRRWFWELLQNASDYNESVDVILEIEPEKVTFKHNGNPFRPIDTENLIAPDSGKDGDDLLTKDSIGQFGTGFISTHVLSSKITIEGVIKSERLDNYFSKFQFTLNRKCFDDKDGLKQSIHDSQQELDNSQKKIEYKAGEFNTSFSYDLTAPIVDIDCKEVVTRGLEYVFELLPYTLLYMPKVKSVTISSSDKALYKFKHSRFTVEERNESGVLVGCDITQHNGTENLEKHNIRLFKVNNSELCIRIEDNKLVGYPTNATKLFCSLPMIGTEDFCFPVIINSKSFVPKGERDGINLSPHDAANRTILTDSVIAFKKLIDTVASDEIKNCHYLIKWPSLHIKNEQDKAWFKNNILDKLRDILLDAKIVDTRKGRILLKDAIFPFISKEDLSRESHKEYLSEFYKLVAELKPEISPIEEVYAEWHGLFDFNLFPKNKYTFDMLLEEVGKMKCLSELEKKVNNPTKWLNDLIKLSLSFNEILLDKYSIVPNQLGDFLLRKDEINWDDSVDPDLLEIYDLITKKDYKTILLHKDFEVNTNLLKPEKTKSTETLAKEIDDAFSELKVDRQSENYLTALRLLFKWVGTDKYSAEKIKEMFKWFTNNQSQLFIDTFDNEGKDQVLIVAQSGKLESLSKLAESNLTESDINSISKNIDSIKLLMNIAAEIGDMDGIVNHAKELLSDKQHFDYLQAIGEKFELAFKDALLRENITAEVIYKGWGSHDYEIHNTLNGKTFFVELKSFSPGSVEPFKLALSQAEKAIKNRNEFALCALERPIENGAISIEFIKEKLKYKKNIDVILNNAIQENANFDKIIKSQNDVRLHINLREDVRVSISQKLIIQDALYFHDLVAEIKKQIE
jgi:hypothetical protein